MQGGSRRVGQGGGSSLFKPGFPQRGSPYQPEQRLPAVQKLEPKPRCMHASLATNDMARSYKKRRKCLVDNLGLMLE